MVDYATCYPEATPLKSIEAETVAEALVTMFSRVGVPEELLSDQGSQERSNEGGEPPAIIESVGDYTLSPHV